MTEQETVGSASALGRGAQVVIARGTTVGRYVVLAHLGAGGMGVVHVAYDPELDRKVAIKVMRASPGAAADRDAQALLLREAQAMAKLSHPNVITVHDVGVLDERLWIAMELVDGDTLRAWSAAASRSWRDVLPVITAAARGLAAAHAAGLVHRDFKPDNVMIGADGRVRVMDFGLARREHADEPPITGPVARGPGSTSAGMSKDPTVAGSFVGTPAYMAPEQHACGAVDARADQFALCVTAWEALYGERPYRGGSVAELSANVVGGQVRDAPAGARVPGWFRRVVRRGLSADPGDRWPTLDDLVEALERGGTRARMRRRIALVGVVALAGGGAFAAFRLDEHARMASCAAEGARIDEVWNERARTSVHDALLATGVSYAETTAGNVMSWLDAYAAAWRVARTDACIDHEIRGTWSAETVDRSLWCLDERRMELEALVQTLADADASAVQRAVPAASALVQPVTCRDTSLLERGPPPPTERVEDVRAIRADLSRAWVLEQTGAFAPGLELARSIRDRAVALDWPPLTAAALAAEAKLLVRKSEYEDAERLAVEAYHEAARAGAWAVAAQAASNLIYVCARLSRHREGETWGIHAEVALVHAGDPASLGEAGRLAQLGLLHTAAGDYVRATSAHEGALALREQALGSEHPIVASSLINLGNVHFNTGDFAAARALYERALEIAQQSFGPDHPEVATILNNLASASARTGDNELARRFFERALDIRERALGPDHPDVAASLSNLATTYERGGGDAKVIELTQRAVGIWERALGPDHPDVATGLGNLAEVHERRGESERARELLTRAVAILEKTLGPGHLKLAPYLGNLAEGCLALDDGPGALAAAERAVAIFDAHQGVQFAEPTARFSLVRALERTGGDRGRARALARQAREQLRDPDVANETLIDRVDRWLAEHREQ